MAPRGCGTCDYTLKFAVISVIFVPKSFKFCIEVDIEAINKFGEKNPKGLCHLGAVALVSM